MFSLICVLINDRVNNREAGDLRSNRIHYDVTVMSSYCFSYGYLTCLLYWFVGSLNEILISSTANAHYSDVMMGAMASQITSLTIICSTVYSGADQRKHQSSAPLAFLRGIHRWPVNSPHKWPVTRKMFLFNDVMSCSIIIWVICDHPLFRQWLDAMTTIFPNLHINNWLVEWIIYASVYQVIIVSDNNLSPVRHQAIT